MKVRNKLTGEIAKLVGYVKIVDGRIFFRFEDDKGTYKKEYNSLAELNEEWTDAPEEPKEYWYIDYDGGILCGEPNNSSTEKMMISMGNHFETIEEAELVVRKLKAWKRLKDAGFEFGGWTHTPITKSLTGYNLHIKAYSDKLADYMDDLQELFGGEE